MRDPFRRAWWLSGTRDSVPRDMDSASTNSANWNPPSPIVALCGKLTSDSNSRSRPGSAVLAVQPPAHEDGPSRASIPQPPSIPSLPDIFKFVLSLSRMLFLIRSLGYPPQPIRPLLLVPTLVIWRFHVPAPQPTMPLFLINTPCPRPQSSPIPDISSYRI